MTDSKFVNPHRRPLYVFDLPPELLQSLAVKIVGGSEREALDKEPGQIDRPDVSTASVGQDGVAQSTSCSLCQLSFPNVQDQRQHVKSDHHRYNLKLNLKDLPTVDEGTFLKTVGDLDESISGSDSESSDDEGGVNVNEPTLSSLLKKQAEISSDGQISGMNVGGKAVSGNAPMYWFTSPKIEGDSLLGVYKALFSNEEQDAAPKSLLDALSRRQVQPIHGKHSGNTSASGALVTNKVDPHYFLCMIGGGHFAAMIVSLIPEVRKGPGGVEERHPIVHAHKTFHRYTTRRKQGGSQSANDNAKGNAHSVGSSIRRANEAALEVDIRQVLSEWREQIDSAELIFVRATGSQNRRILFGPYDGQVLTSRDKRLRGFPFSTRRATQAELLRSFQELTRLKVSTVVEVIPEPAKVKAPPPKAVKPVVERPKISKEDEAAQLHTSQLENLVRRSKAPAVLLYLSKNEVSPNFRFYPPAQHHHAPTPLHLAASTGSAAVVTALLLKAKADPAMQNDDGKPPYDLAGDHRTRDAFRVARHDLGEDAHDWTAAHVPAGMTQAEAAERAEAEKTSGASAEAERRKADLERIKQEEEQRAASKMERKGGAGKSLGSAAEKSGSEKREEETRGLTPEMRMRIERERRARAAEERMRKMQSGN
ncbi:uncharacterized protein AB675_9149 [Cyphellophora attinorum]|uniref:VLRF1 domain-containing protein n=1 Tax=Cyphellophora attinorum TaxID=1664694 RepID=A0A0N0NNL2_9EURO|nr:uncharacterized protein AB675_9149 [Phialophora attinorum]KPI41509.1 hypothetical protein AB675_9149 [Phialophora attinorum]